MNAKVYRSTPRNLAYLARALCAGKLVAVPTETVYGLAADALNPRACRAIFRAKGRPSNDPLIVHIHKFAQLAELAEENSAVAKVAKAFWPGPLTLVLHKKSIVPDIVTSGRSSVAIRMPSHPVFLKLLRLCGRPLAAPSANPFGYISPTTAAHVKDGLGRRIAFILDGGAATIGLESTILDLRNPNRPRILRPGAIERAELERVLGHRVETSRTPARSSEPALAPGMLTRHYSPKTQLILHRKLSANAVQKGAADEAFILIKPFVRKSVRSTIPNTVTLSPAGDLKDCAKSLFATLRQLDRGKWKRIHAELAPGKSAFALAINDRLTRASAKTPGRSS